MIFTEDLYLYVLPILARSSVEKCSWDVLTLMFTSFAFLVHLYKLILRCLYPCISSQGNWILSIKDEYDNSKLFRLYMYVVKCVNDGSSKDPFLTQVSEFAVLLGNELDAEVYDVIKLPFCHYDAIK